MGIKQLSRLISYHVKELTLKSAEVRGKLLVDGYVILHEIYTLYKLNWADGGSYPKQHKAVVKYFETMVKAGVEPIVILEGGGSETKIQDTVEVRQKDIKAIPAAVRKQHEIKDNQDYRNHYLPILARQAYVASLKQIDKVEVYTCDGKAPASIVKLANHFECPVLTNDSSYCVSDLIGGVILYFLFDPTKCTARVFMQSMLVNFLKLNNPNLLYVIVAILGNNPSIPSVYHGEFKERIELTSVGPGLEDKPWIITIINYLKNNQIDSFENFKKWCKREKYHELIINCQSVEQMFIPLSGSMTVCEFKENTEMLCSRTQKFPKEILSKYRECSYPENVVNVFSVGKCTLEVHVGDPDQPPVSRLGKCIRQFMYGLATPLLRRDISKCVKEYYRSEFETSPWEYVPHEIQPVYKSTKLATDEIFMLNEEERVGLAKAKFCELLESPPDILENFNVDLDAIYLLAILSTCFWAKHVKKSKELTDPVQLIKSLVLSLLICPDKTEEKLHQTQYHDPSWVKVYHAVLEWQALYRDVADLNSMLLYPFSELHPSNYPDCSFVICLALDHPRNIDTYRGQLTNDQQMLYDKTLALCN